MMNSQKKKLKEMRNEFQLFRLLRFIIIKYIDYVHVYVHILNSKFIVEKNSRFRSLLIVGGICLTKPVKFAFWKVQRILEEFQHDVSLRFFERFADDFLWHLCV